MEKIQQKDSDVGSEVQPMGKRKLPRVEKRREKLKNKIIEVAGKHFAFKNIETVRLEEIAEEVDISRATLYSFFDSKDHLLEEIVKPILEELILFYEELLKKEKVYTDKILESLVTIYFELWMRYEYRFFVLNKMWETNRSSLKNLIIKFHDLNLSLFEKIEKKYLKFPKENSVQIFIFTIIPILRFLKDLPEGSSKVSETIKNLLIK